MPINWNLLDTSAPQKLAQMFDPNAIAMRNAQIQAEQNKGLLAQAQLAGAMNELKRAPVLEQRQDQEWAYKQAEFERLKQAQSKKTALMDALKEATPEQQKQILVQMFPEAYAKEQFKAPAVKDFNQPFLPDGTPNTQYQDWKLREQAASRAPGNEIAQQRLNLAMERLELDRQKAASATDGKPMTADQEARFKERMGKAYGSTNIAMQSANSVIGIIDQIKKLPGLKGITGVSGYLPDIPGGQSAIARQKVDTLLGKITKMAKDAAASSGSLGSMATQEWRILRDQVESIDTTKLDDKQLIDVLDDVAEQARIASSIASDTYNTTYGDYFDKFPAFGTVSQGNSAAPKANGETALTPNQVMLPDGRVKQFPSKAAADAFRKQAGL